MSTIRKTLKDKDGNYICPAIPSRSIEGGDIKLNTVKAENIDFTTLPGNYSLDEIDTGYTWVDGKPIYRKVIQTDVAATTSWQNIGTIQDMDKLINVYGSLYRDDGLWVNSPRSTIEIYIDTSKNVNWRNGELNSSKLYQVLEYTKTTD